MTRAREKTARPGCLTPTRDAYLSAGGDHHRNAPLTSEDGSRGNGRYARLRPLGEPPLFASVRPERDHGADQEDDPREPDQVDERLDEHLQVDGVDGVPFAELELVA